MCCSRHLVEDRGLRGGGRDAVDRDVVAGKLLAERLGQRDDAGLRRRIGGGVRIALLAGDRGDVDDAAVVLRDHQRHHGAAAQERPVEIDAHHLRPCLRRIFGDRHVGPGDAGVVDQDVDAAERRDRGVARALDVRQRRHIDGERLDAAVAPQFVRGPLSQAPRRGPRSRPRRRNRAAARRWRGRCLARRRSPPRSCPRDRSGWPSRVKLLERPTAGERLSPLRASGPCI